MSFVETCTTNQTSIIAYNQSLILPNAQHSNYNSLKSLSNIRPKRLQSKIIQSALKASYIVTSQLELFCELKIKSEPYKPFRESSLTTSYNIIMS